MSVLSPRDSQVFTKPPLEVLAHLVVLFARDLAACISTLQDVECRAGRRTLIVPRHPAKGRTTRTAPTISAPQNDEENAARSSRLTKERDRLAEGHVSCAFGCFDIFELLNDAEALFKVGFRDRVVPPVAAYFTWQGNHLEARGVLPNVAEPLSPEALWNSEDN